MLVCRIFPSALPSLSFFIIKLLINYSLDSKAVKCSSSDFICQRSFWLLQFVQLQIAPIVQTCSWLLMWCAKAPVEQPLLESTTQEQQVSRRPVGCFHKLEGLLLQFGIPLWAGYLLVLPSSFCNTVLLRCATEITPAGGTCCLWGFFKVPGHYWDSRQTLVLKISLQILEILWLFQLSALLKNLCCVSKLKESFFFSTCWYFPAIVSRT